jgi:hypothetical protein
MGNDNFPKISLDKNSSFFLYESASGSDNGFLLPSGFNTPLLPIVALATMGTMSACRTLVCSGVSSVTLISFFK